MYHRQRGAMKREYTSTEKHQHLEKNFEVGDVVLRYVRTKEKKSDTIRTLESCYPAVITSFDQRTVRLTHYPIVQTLLTRRIELGEVDQELISKGKDPYYSPDDYYRFEGNVESFLLTEIGVGTHTFSEECFFIKPVDTDGTFQYFETKEGIKRFWLSTLDTIYAVFEDRKVEYNKERFLQEYYSKNRQPIFNTYANLNKETVSDVKKIKSTKRGGSRTGAGRKSLGVKKPVSITLPEDTWNEIDNLIQSGTFKSYAEYFRSLILDKQ